MTPTDIANRALQHLGASRIADGALLTEDSKNASEVRACYDSLRRLELRSNFWSFAIRKAVLRPLTTTTKFITFGNYAAGTTYAKNDIVVSAGIVYQSRIASNIGNTPASSPAAWARYTGPDTADTHTTTVSYYAGEFVVASSVLYLSKISDNTDTPPSSNWQAMTTAPTLNDPNIVYPIGFGPASQTTTRNVLKLPTGFLRLASQDPKRVQAPSDWVLENGFVLSEFPGAVIFRYVADIADTDQFDPAFSEGLSARIAMDLCETITQSNTKKSILIALYNDTMAKARMVNSIENGWIEPPEDDYITVRH